jgi:hypothetical protein
MLGRVHDISGQPSGGAVELGTLLAILHRADAGFDRVEATYRIWRHDERASAARRARIEQAKRGARRSPATARQAAQTRRLKPRPCCGSGAPRTGSERSGKVGHATVPTPSVTAMCGGRGTRAPAL